MNDTPEPIGISQQTPGQMIKAVREAKRISISEVAQRLLLSKQNVNALEEDDYSKISAQVYAEGYLKAYAQFLQIPVDTILQSFRRLNIYSGAEIKVDINSQVEDRLNRLNLNCILKNRCVSFMLLGAVGVLVLSVSVFFVTRLFIGKSTEVVTAPNVLDGTTSLGRDIVEKEQVPVVTTDTTELSLEKSGKNGGTSEASGQVPIDTLNLDIPTEKTKFKNNEKIK